MSDAKQLPKVMGWPGVALFTVSWTIGSAIFRVPSEIATYAGSADWMMVLWLVGLLLALSGVFVYLELAVRLPRSGGDVVYLKTAFGAGTAFVFGWTTVLMSAPAGMAAVARTFADYAGSLMLLSERQLRVVAASIIAFHTVAAIRSTRFTAGFVSLAGVGKIAALLIVLALSFSLSPADEPTPPALASVAPSLTGLAIGLVSVIWAFDGLLSATLLTGEVRNPARDMPLGIICGTLMVAGLYVLLSTGYVRVLGFTGVQASSAVAADTMGALLGHRGVLLMAALVMASTFVTVGAALLGVSRSVYAMAQEGLFFRPFAHLHPRWGTPWLAVALLGTMAMGMVCVGDFGYLIRLYVFVTYPFLALTAVGAIRLRRRDGLPSDYRMPLYPWPIVSFGGLITFIVTLGAVNDLTLALYGPVVIALGVLAYYAWRQVTARKGAAARPGLS
jgi:basic amino acid/polyamine antiporter, APA family